jgi:hypothetical protein
MTMRVDIGRPWNGVGEGAGDALPEALGAGESDGEGSGEGEGGSEGDAVSIETDGPVVAGDGARATSDGDGEAGCCSGAWSPHEVTAVRTAAIAISAATRRTT